MASLALGIVKSASNGPNIPRLSNPYKFVFYKRKDSPLSFQPASDLKPYTIGIGRGYANPSEIFAAGLTTEEGNSDDESQKLFLKRIDLVLIGHNLAEVFNQKRTKLNMRMPLSKSVNP